jgi:hypothetical protein
VLKWIRSKGETAGMREKRLAANPILKEREGNKEWRRKPREKKADIRGKSWSWRRRKAKVREEDIIKNKIRKTFFRFMILSVREWNHFLLQIEVAKENLREIPMPHTVLKLSNSCCQFQPFRRRPHNGQLTGFWGGRCNLQNKTIGLVAQLGHQLVQYVRGLVQRVKVLPPHPERFLVVLIPALQEDRNCEMLFPHKPMKGICGAIARHNKVVEASGTHAF